MCFVGSTAWKKKYRNEVFSCIKMVSPLHHRPLPLPKHNPHPPRMRRKLVPHIPLHTHPILALCKSDLELRYEKRNGGADLA